MHLRRVSQMFRHSYMVGRIEQPWHLHVPHAQGKQPLRNVMELSTLSAILQGTQESGNTDS